MSSLGNLLRQSREEKGLTLLDIAERTNISRRYLEALEAGQFDILPADPFVRGFLRTYAQVVRLDYGELVTLYREELDPTEDEIEPEGLASDKAGGEISGSRSASRAPRAVAFAVGIIVLIGLSALGGWWVALNVPFGRNASLPSSPVSSLNANRGASARLEGQTVAQPPLPRSAPRIGQTGGQTSGLAGPVESAPVAAALRTSAAQPPVTLQRDGLSLSIRAERLQRDGLVTGRIGGPGQSAGDDAATPPPEKNLTLRVHADAANWLRLTIDKESAQLFTLASGEDRLWKAADTFLLTIGNVGATKVYLNNVRLALPVSEDNVLRDYSIDIDSLR